MSRIITVALVAAGLAMLPLADMADSAADDRDNTFIGPAIELAVPEGPYSGSFIGEAIEAPVQNPNLTWREHISGSVTVHNAIDGWGPF